MNSTVDFSLAEIDLASRASIFVGSEHSEWARAAVADRRGKDPESKDFSFLAMLVSGVKRPVELRKIRPPNRETLETHAVERSEEKIEENIEKLIPKR